MSYCPQERPVFDDLPVRDNLVLMRASRKLGPFRPYFDRFPILERRLTQHAGTLSGGEKKILSFVRGLAEDQPVVLLDEPSEGVQWENILHMEAFIAEKKAASVCVHRRRAESGLRRAYGGSLPDHGPGPHDAGGIAVESTAATFSRIYMCEPPKAAQRRR